MDVSIILVNYKTPELIVDCVDSIQKNIQGLKYEIVVVDNASGDNSEKIINERCKNVKLILNEKNLGFGVANNIGVDNSSGKYLFFLNSDTLLLNNALLYFYEFCENNQNVGAVGCWLIDGDGEKTLSAAEFTNLKNASSEYTVLLKNKFRRNKKICDKYLFYSDEEVKKVDVVIGADLFVSRSVFEKVKRFDKDFFMYHEEMHLCHKLANHGYENYIINKPQIVHLCGKSQKKKIERDIMIDSNLFIYFEKIGIKKISLLFRVKFFGIRFLYYIKNKYAFSDISKYIKSVKNSNSYLRLKKGK